MSPRRPKLIIFDCDGVLVDSEPISVDVLIDIIGSAGATISREVAYGRFLGKSMASVSFILRDEFGVDFTPEHLDRVSAELARRFAAELQAIDGIAQTLRLLPIRACVASSSPPERIRLSLDVTGLLPLLEPHLFSAAMVENGKPAPDLFLHAAAEMGVDPADCLVIEDSPAGVDAAKRAGMRVFGFTGGAHARTAAHREALLQHAPDLIFEDMSTLPELIEKSWPSRRRKDAGPLVAAVDVGTGSARAGIFTQTGTLIGSGEHEIAMHQPQPNHAEHDSEDIWRAVCKAVRQALGSTDPARVKGLSFDATCSLVIRGADGRQVSVSTSGDPRWDTIVWLDHRALAEADECTATGNRFLDVCGGVMPPEMQSPKLMWLKRHLPENWNKSGLIFDLVDFLTWRATGRTERSQCTLACKWPYLAKEERWPPDFLEAIGLSDLISRAGLPDRASPVGLSLGPLTREAAADLGLAEDCVVAIGLIDAYAGALGVLGGYANEPRRLDRHLALIAGTSSCVMAMSEVARDFPEGWGPYPGAALPNLWLCEGGQSATGALLDHVIRLHGGGAAPDRATHARICARVAELRALSGGDLAPRLHVLPDFHGNRSPLVDPHAVGVISGLVLDATFDGLCRLYWRTALAIALGVRHILDALARRGFAIDTLHVTGGHTRNPLLMELYADVTGCTVVEQEGEDVAVLLGTAMVAAAGAGLYADVASACIAMQWPGRSRQPDPDRRRLYERDYRIFLELHEQRQALEQMMESDPDAR